MVSFKTAMVASYRPFIVAYALALTIRPQFVIDCFRCSHNRKWLSLGQNVGRKGRPMLAKF